MTKVSYFQRFSQKENHATNNTMLVMRFFYQHSPQKIEAALSALIDDELEVGLAFEQQIKSSESVPDALISQRPLQLYFETKRGGNLDKDQIARHIASIKGEECGGGRKILFGLTRTPISQTDRNDLTAKAKQAQISFAAITFADIVQALRENCATHESDLLEILSDYEEYLSDEGLMQIGDVMTVVPCGTSLIENVTYRLYFEPPSRPSKSRSKFLGLYHNKRVQYLGQIEKVIIGKPEGASFKVDETELGKPDTADLERILSAINACSYYPDLRDESTRYYLLRTIEETDIIKTSKGGIWGPRVFNLSEWLSYSDISEEYDAASAAKYLRGKTFE